MSHDGRPDPYALAMGDTWDQLFELIPGLRRSKKAEAEVSRRREEPRGPDAYSLAMGDYKDSIIDKIPGLRHISPDVAPVSDARIPAAGFGRNVPTLPLAAAAQQQPQQPQGPTYGDPVAQRALAGNPQLARAVGTPELFSKEEDASNAAFEREMQPQNLRAIDAEIARMMKDPRAAKQLAILQAERARIAAGETAAPGMPGQQDLSMTTPGAGAAPGAAPPSPMSAAGGNATVGQQRIAELRAEIEGLIGKTQGPMFTPEEAQGRRDENNRMMQMGAIAQLANLSSTRPLGKALTSEAQLAAREKVTDHGLLDPLSGEFKFMPGYQEQRRGELLTKAMEALIKQEDMHQIRNLGLPAGMDYRNIPKGSYWNQVTGRIEDFGPQAVKQTTAYGAAAKGLQDAAMFAQNQTRVIDDLLKNERGFAQIFPGTGFTGAVGRLIAPVTPEGSAARSSVESLKSLFSQQGLASIRSSGQSIGQITEREWPILERLIGNLDSNTPPDVARRQIDQVKQRLAAALEMDRQNFLRTWKNTQYWDERNANIGAPAAPAPAAPAGDAGWKDMGNGVRIRQVP